MYSLKLRLKTSEWIAFRTKKLYAIFLILLLTNDFAFAVIWPVATPNTSAIFIQKDSFITYSQTELDATVVGPLSNNIYYLYKLSSTLTAVIRKMNPDNTLNWMTALGYEPTVWSMAVSLDEQNVYISSNTGPIKVTRLSAINGAIVDSINQ